jgi:hypothetical protein
MAEQVRVNRLRRLNSPDRIGKPLLRSGSGISCAPPMPLCRGAPNGKAQPPLRAAENGQNAPDLVRAAVGCSGGWAASELERGA